ASYLFNSQLLTIPDGGMLLLCPAECERDTDIRSAIDEILAGDHPIRAVEFVDVRESMRNGGGPACLRLRVVVREDQAGLIHPDVRLDAALYARLADWIDRHYRETLTVADLADPLLLRETRAALDELTRMLGLG